MRKSKFTEEQITHALSKVAWAGGHRGLPRDGHQRGYVLQAHRLMSRWKKKYAGLGVTELRRLRQLEDENRQLKQLVADLLLDKHMLQEVIRKKL